MRSWRFYTWASLQLKQLKCTCNKGGEPKRVGWLCSTCLSHSFIAKQQRENSSPRGAHWIENDFVSVKLFRPMSPCTEPRNSHIPSNFIKTEWGNALQNTYWEQLAVTVNGKMKVPREQGTPHLCPGGVRSRVIEHASRIQAPLVTMATQWHLPW